MNIDILYDKGLSYFIYMLKHLIFGPVKQIINLGDQALLLGCISRITKGECIYIYTSRNTDILFLQDYYERIIFLYSPSKCSNFLIRFMDLLTCCIFFIKHLFIHLQAIHFLGADVIDGRYGRIPYSYGFALVFYRFFSETCYVSSFSFNTFYNWFNRFVFNSIKQVAIFEPRDSISLELFKRECMPKNLTLVRDFSFLLSDVSFDSEAHDWIMNQRSLGHRILLFCPAKRPNIINMDDFLLRLVESLNEWNMWSFIIVCHVFDKETLNICYQAKALFHDRAFLLTYPDVALVRSITSQVDLVFSCLMHCGLGGVKHGIPTILLDYNNKMKNISFDLKNKKLNVLEKEHDFINALFFLKNENNI